MKTLSPPVWNSGALSMATSSPVSPQLTAVLIAFQAIFPCVRIAPLGSPVVPPV